MKNKITKNLWIKALSLCLAILFWIMVINIDDPVRTRQFTNVPVSVINEDAVSTLDKVYEIVQGKTVDITVTGKKSRVDKVTMQDLSATADLSQLSVVNAVNIYPECAKFPSLTCTLGKVQTMIVSLENMKTAQFVPVIQQIGTVADGYYVVSATSKPNIIKVTGAKSQVRKVYGVRLEVDVSNAKKTLVTRAEPKAYGADGQELESDKFKFSVSQARIELDVRKTKTIPVTLSVGEQTESDYVCTSIEYEPKEIVIAGGQNKLEKIEELIIPIDLTGWFQSGEQTFNVGDYLPSNITVSEVNPVVSVQLTIERLTSKKFYFTASEVALEGQENNYTYEWEKGQKAYEITIQGIQSSLQELNVSKLRPHVNVEDLEKGKHKVTVLFDELEGSSILSEEIQIPIKIS